MKRYDDDGNDRGRCFYKVIETCESITCIDCNEFWPAALTYNKGDGPERIKIEDGDRFEEYHAFFETDETRKEFEAIFGTGEPAQQILDQALDKAFSYDSDPKIYQIHDGYNGCEIRIRAGKFELATFIEKPKQSV